jgi:transcriptional antiterminator
MNTLSSKDYKVLKIFNNNVLLVFGEGKEKILYSKGIGFGKHENEIVVLNPKTAKVFSIEDETNSNKFNQLMEIVDNDLIGICEEMIYMIGKELNEELNEKIHISLTDHIAFTLKRLKENEEILNPFLIETETLYKQEFEIASKAIRILEKKTGIIIPDGEIGFITLHIHSARNQGKLSNTIKYTFLTNTIVEYIEDSLDLYIDRRSIDYARFITHIRFAIERIMNKNPIKNELLDVVKHQYPASYKLAKKIGKLIENDLHIDVVDDEIGYIAIHIERFKNAC